MEHPQDDESGSINKRDAGAVLAEYAVWLGDQPLSARTREAYLAAVTAFAGWLVQRHGGVGDALLAPRARDIAARDYKRHMKVQRGLAAASVNQALAGMDHLFRFLGLGAAIVRREELPRSAPRALDVEQQRYLLRAAEESTARDRAIVALLLFTGLRLAEAAALQVTDVRVSARKGLVVVRSGKGDAYREVELNALVRGMLDEWVTERAKLAAPGETSFFRRPHRASAVLAIDRSRGAPRRGPGWTFNLGSCASPHVRDWARARRSRPRADRRARGAPAPGNHPSLQPAIRG